MVTTTIVSFLYLLVLISILSHAYMFCFGRVGEAILPYLHSGSLGVLPLMTSDSSTDDAKACRAVKLYSFGVQYDEYCDILQHPVLSLKAPKILNPKREL